MKSFVPDPERDLVFALIGGEIDEQEFLRQFKGDPVRRTVAWIERASRDRDPLAAELALSLGHRFGFTPETLPWLHKLASADWHDRHEDVVDALSILAAPDSVQILYETALAEFPYREYDEFQSLGVKCVRALHRIPSLDAVARLGDLSKAGNSILSQKAMQMLQRLAEGSQDMSIRDAAVKAIS